MSANTIYIQIVMVNKYTEDCVKNQYHKTEIVEKGVHVHV